MASGFITVAWSAALDNIHHPTGRDRAGPPGRPVAMECNHGDLSSVGVSASVRRPPGRLDLNPYLHIVDAKSLIHVGERAVP